MVNSIPLTSAEENSVFLVLRRRAGGWGWIWRWRVLIIDKIVFRWMVKKIEGLDGMGGAARLAEKKKLQLTSESESVRVGCP